MSNDFTIANGLLNGTFKSTNNAGVHTPHHNAQILDASGNPIVSAAGALAGTERGLVVRALLEGLAAHDAAVAGAPARIGARAVSALYTAVSSGDTADLIATLVGALINKPFSIPENDWNYAAAAAGILNTTTAVTFKVAAGAGLKNYITAIQLHSEALTTATEVVIRKGAAGTVIWRRKIGTAGILTGHDPVFPTPLQSDANQLLEVCTLTASGAGAVYFNAQGYVAP